MIRKQITHGHDLVSYPRSGSHFLHLVIGMYCGCNVYGNVYTPTHDWLLTEKKNGCLYVWRNPVEIIFSYYSVESCNDERVIDFSFLTDKWLDEHTRLIKEHFKFYWENAGLIVRYKDIMADKAWYDILTFQRHRCQTRPDNRPVGPRTRY